MDFKAALKDMVDSVDGSIGAGLVGLDGLVIDQVSMSGDFDITVVGAEYATIVKNSSKAARNFGLGKTDEIMVSTEKATMIMTTVGEEYFIALALGLDGNLGRGRLELKKQAAKFAQALA
ncbi:MAG TPA: roadblock/LC7 domain-containing protein [bacterium]|jgi:predicted regulator of Ras-like GTPase activity (Roadblock/LC7/MglB family)|nr:roadblock/LC7 domain-containing protein [bacterium]